MVARDHMLVETIPSVISKDLLKYIKSKQDIIEEDICEIFIDQMVEEVCKRRGKNKLVNYKTKKYIYDNKSEGGLYRINSSTCIIINLTTSSELGEAYPGYVGIWDEKSNIFKTEVNFTLNETDAFFFEIKNKAIFRQPCKHKQVLDLIITSD
jgi:hypothetical protein